jgi:hypothetical protein
VGKIITYYDMYGYIVSNPGYSLSEILTAPSLIRFRHSKPQEIEVMKTFIFKYMIDGVYYFGFELPRKLPFDVNTLRPEVRYDSVKLSRFKVDCILETDVEFWIIEVKDYLLSTALSQPIIYEDLFKTYVKPTKPTKKVLVCGESALEIVEVAKKLGIEVYVLNIPTARKHISELL